MQKAQEDHSNPLCVTTFCALVLRALGVILNVLWGKWGEVFPLQSRPPVVPLSPRMDTGKTICCRNLHLKLGTLGRANTMGQMKQPACRSWSSLPPLQILLCIGSLVRLFAGWFNTPINIQPGPSPTLANLPFACSWMDAMWVACLRGLETGGAAGSLDLNPLQVLGSDSGCDSRGFAAEKLVGLLGSTGAVFTSRSSGGAMGKEREFSCLALPFGTFCLQPS